MSPSPPLIPNRTKNQRENVRSRKNENDLQKNLSEIYENVKSVPNYSSKIRDFLRQNTTSSLFRQVRHKFKRRKIKSYFRYQYVMSDTINYRMYAGSNNGFKYIMVFICVLSKKAYAAPMKRMNDMDAVIAMESILKKLPDVPQNIITDLGTEYYNSKMAAVFTRFGIKHYSIRGKHKACVAERFIRTIKSRIEKYFWENNTHKWIDILDQFIDNYNNTYHRSIKMPPNKVTDENRLNVFRTLYPKTKDYTKPRLNKGDKVRVLKQKNLFEKGYTRSWSIEIYVIVKAYNDSGVDFYSIKDSEGNILSRKKYYWELNLVSRHAS